MGSSIAPSIGREVGEFGAIAPQAVKTTTGPNVGGSERLLSLTAGSLLSVFGLRRGGLSGLALGLLGANLLYRGASGRCGLYRKLGISTVDDDGARQVRIERTITINAPAERIYQFWVDPANLVEVLSFVEQVSAIDERHSHWVVETPAGNTEWDATITELEPNRKIAWQSDAGSPIVQHGCLRLREAPGGRGTEVKLEMAIQPPLGAAGAALGKLADGLTAEVLGDDLHRLKCLLETGEIPTSGTPSAPRSLKVKALQRLMPIPA